jgi:hypothetical protein
MDDNYTPMTGQPVQQYVPPSPYAPPQPVPEKKGIHPVIIVAAVVICIIVLMFVAMIAFFSAIDDLGGEPWEETEDIEEVVFIDEGGHYWVLLTDGWSDEFQVNLTIESLDGGPFDVYIMDTSQYENAYSNWSTGAFSSTVSWQNVTNVIDLYIEEDPRQQLYLVIDNVETAHVPGNAVPDGIIQVRLELTLIHRNEGW